MLDKVINMRTSLNNPFSPGSDTIPEVWAGRTEQLVDWRNILRPRLLAGLTERGRTILGEPGLGKSTLVRRIAQEAGQAGDWVTPQLRIPLDSDPLKPVAQAVLALADRAGLSTSRESKIAEMFRQVEAIAVQGISLTLHEKAAPEPYVSLRDLLIEVGRAAIGQKKLALIHIDEIQNITDERALSQLLIALGDALTFEEIVEVPGGTHVRRSLPLAVYLSGLPEFEDRAGARHGATFARRFKTTTLTALSDDDLATALQPFVMEGWEVADGEGDTSRIRMEQDAVAAIIDLCRGEPFLFQLAGEQAWYAGSSETITRDQVLQGWNTVLSEATAHVERILGRLPQREHDFLQAMAKTPQEDRTLTRIASTLGYEKTTDAGPTAQRLDTVRGIISRGKPYTFRHRAVEAYLTSSWPRID